MNSCRSLLGAAVLAALLVAGCGGGEAGISFGITGIGLVGEPVQSTGAGDIVGGEVFTVRGAGFQDTTQFFFGTDPAANVVYVSGAELRVTTPPMPEGPVDLRVLNDDGEEYTAPGAFTFAIPPTLVLALATEGPVAGEPRVMVDDTTAVEITGTGLKDGVRLWIDGSERNVTFVDANTIRADAPSRATEQVVDLQIRNPEGLEADLPGSLTYTQDFSLAVQPGGLSADQLRHLMRRVSFGIDPSLLSALTGRDTTYLANYLLRIDLDPALQAVEGNASLIYGQNVPPAGDINARTNQEWWIYIIRNNPKPLQERMAWFLHDHFATSQDVLDAETRWWMHDQIQLFRRFGMRLDQGGLDWNWRDLLVAVAKDRAMLRWLDGTNSRKGRPNENFARELWELFMLGEGNGYTEADIQEAARAFTGFERVDVLNQNYDTVVYRQARHDEEQKTIFGVTGFWGYDSVSPHHEAGAALETDFRDSDGGIVDLTLQRRPVEASTFICRKLAAFFLYDDPPDVVVDSLAQTLRGSNWDLRPVLERIIRSKAMFSSKARKSKIKSPTEFVFQFLRQTGIDYPENRIRGTLLALDQSPMDPPDVDGWPGGNAWMGGQSMLERINFVRDVIETLDDVPTQIDPLIPPAGQRDPDQLVDHIARRLDVELSPLARQELISYVTTEMFGGVEIPLDFDPTDDAQLEMKTRGLLYLIAQYHDGHRQ